MNTTGARKTVILVWLAVLGILFFGEVSQGNHLPQPKKFFGASVAYLGLAIAADFAAPVVIAFSYAFAFYILLQNTDSLSGLQTLTSGKSAASVAAVQNTGAPVAGQTITPNSAAATNQ